MQAPGSTGGWARGVLHINYSDDFFVASDLDPVYAIQATYRF